MSNKQIIGVVALLLGLLALLAAFFAYVVKQSVIQSEPANIIETYQNNYVTSSNDENINVSYEFNYVSPEFEVVNTSGSVINIKESDKLHTIQIFNNETAGFASSTDFWDHQNYCPTCKKVASTLSPIGGSDVVTYSSDTEDWIVYQHDPGFVIIKLQRPDESAYSVIKTLTITTTKTKAK